MDRWTPRQPSRRDHCGWLGREPQIPPRETARVHGLGRGRCLDRDSHRRSSEPSRSSGRRPKEHLAPVLQATATCRTTGPRDRRFRGCQLPVEPACSSHADLPSLDAAAGAGLRVRGRRRLSRALLGPPAGPALARADGDELGAQRGRDRFVPRSAHGRHPLAAVREDRRDDPRHRRDHRGAVRRRDARAPERGRCSVRRAAGSASRAAGGACDAASRARRADRHQPQRPQRPLDGRGPARPRGAPVTAVRQRPVRIARRLAGAAAGRAGRSAGRAGRRRRSRKSPRLPRRPLPRPHLSRRRSRSTRRGASPRAARTRRSAPR